MINIQFKILAEKQDAEGKMPIFLVFYYQAKTVKKYVNEKCLPAQWNEEKQCFKKNFEGFFDANLYLQQIKSKIETAMRNFAINGITPSLQEVKDTAEQIIRPQQKQNFEKVLDIFQIFMKYKKSKNIVENTTLTYNTVFSNLEKFFVKFPKFQNIKNFTNQALDIFVNEKLSQNTSPNSINLYTSKIVAMLNFAQEELNLNIQINTKKVKPLKKIDSNVIYLEKHELELFENVQVKPKYQATKDAYILACNTGLRISDIKQIKPELITKDKDFLFLNIYQEKTKKNEQNFLNNKCKQILEKYNFNLPLKSEDTINLQLKIIAEQAKINQPIPITVYENLKPHKIIVPKYQAIHFHTARHTFATLSIIKGMNLKILSKILGHSKIDMTEKYLQIVQNVKNDEMNKYWND